MTEKQLPRVVMVTADGSRWLIDEDFVKKQWDDYCSDIERYDQDNEFDIDALYDEIDFHANRTSWEEIIFPHVRLVEASRDLFNLINYGICDRESDDALDLPALEIASNKDLSEGGI